MGRIGVSEYQVFQAADLLAADGVHPSVDTVRVELGNTGSRTTINKYLKAWRERRAHREQAGANLGAHLLQVLTEQSELLLAVIESECAAKFEAKSQQYESSLQTQNERLRQQDDEIKHAKSQLQALQAELDKTHNQLLQTQSVLADKRDENLSLHESLARETGRRETLERAHTERDRELSAVRKELKTVQARNEIVAESLAAKSAELQQIQLREREHQSTIKEKSGEIRRLNLALKTAQHQRETDIGRLTHSVAQLVKSQPAPRKASKK